jgi:hypothetical protein
MVLRIAMRRPVGRDTSAGAAAPAPAAAVAGPGGGASAAAAASDPDPEADAAAPYAAAAAANIEVAPDVGDSTPFTTTLPPVVWRNGLRTDLTASARPNLPG